MKISNKGVVELVGHEGICLSKYKDSVGVWTVGIGATQTELPSIASWPLSRTITMQEAFQLLKKSVVRYEDELNKYITREVSQSQFDALVSWCYNVGIGWVKKATVIKLLNEGVTGKKLADALMMFNRPKEIGTRRAKEANLLAYGKYANDGKALLFPVSSNGYPIYSKGKQINVWEYIETATDEQPVPVHVDKKEEKVLEAKPSSLLNALNTFVDMFRKK